MRILQHPKIKAIPSPKRILAIPKVTGKFDKSEWTKDDRKIIRKLFKQYEDESVLTKIWSEHFWNDLYTNHRQVWKKFSYFSMSRIGFIDSGLKHHVERALANEWCPMCDNSWRDSPHPGNCCYQCKTKYPEECKRVDYDSRVKADWEDPNRDEKYRLRLEKSMAANIERCGSAFPLQSEEGMNKLRATNLATRGVEYAAQDPKVAEKMANSISAFYKNNPEVAPSRAAAFNADPVKYLRRSEKLSAAWERKSQDEINAITEARAKSSLANWGFRSPMQNHEVHARANSKSSLKRTFVIQGRKFDVQGGAESFLVHELVKRFGAKQVITQFDSRYDKAKAVEDCGYVPDFYIKSKDKYVECKSSYTLLDIKGQLAKNRIKAETSGSKLVFIVQMNGYQHIYVTLPTKWYTWSKKKIVAFLNTGYAIKRAKLMSSAVAYAEHRSNIQSQAPLLV